MSDFISETNDLQDQLSNQILTFDSLNRNGRKIIVFLSAAVLATVLLVVCFHFFKRYSILIALFLVFWVLSFSMVSHWRRMVKQVILDFDTIIIKGYGWLKQLKYESVAKIYHQCIFVPSKPPYPNGLLILLDWKGKVIGRISTKMEKYDFLETELLRRIKNATGKQVYSREEELFEIRRNRKRRQHIFLRSFGIALLGVCCTLLTNWINWKDSHQPIKHTIVSTEATITRLTPIQSDASIIDRYTSTIDNRTPVVKEQFYVLKYVFTADEKEYTRTKLLDELEWANLKDKKTVTVQHLLDNPNENWLKQEWNPNTTDSFRHRLQLGLTLLTTLLWTVFFVFFGVLGYDLVTYNGITYFLKSGQILEDRLDESASLSNKCSDKQ
jgi:hypothetical protein